MYAYFSSIYIFLVASNDELIDTQVDLGDLDLRPTSHSLNCLPVLLLGRIYTKKIIFKSCRIK